MAQVLLIYLSSHSLVVVHRSPAQLEVEVKQLCYIIVVCTTSCSRKGDFCNRQKVCAFIDLNDQGYRTLSCVEMLSSKVGLNFHLQAFHFIIKEGYTMMLLGVCSASSHSFLEHTPLRCHLSSVVLGRRQCFGRCCFCTVFNWRLQTVTENLQIYFPWICERFSKVSCECLSVLHWSISMSAITDLPETAWCPGRAIKVFFVLLTENTANLKISITYWEVLRLKMSITSLKSQDWALYLEFFSNAPYLLGAE